MPAELGRRHAVALERARRDRHQPIEFAAVTVRVVPARHRQYPAGLQRAVKIVPRLHGVEAVFGERQAAGRRGRPGVDQRNLDQVVAIG